jgi:hypothetical protein
MNDANDDDATAADQAFSRHSQSKRKPAPTDEELLADIAAVATRLGIRRGGLLTFDSYHGAGGRFALTQFYATLGWKRMLKMAGFSLRRPSSAPVSQCPALEWRKVLEDVCNVAALRGVASPVLLKWRDYEGYGGRYSKPQICAISNWNEVRRAAASLAA